MQRVSMSIGMKKAMATDRVGSNKVIISWLLLTVTVITIISFTPLPVTTASRYPEYVVFGVSQKEYSRSQRHCDEMNGTFTGELCHGHHRHEAKCTIGGTVCARRYSNRRMSALCCCINGKNGACCDDKAVCPNCTRPVCPDYYDPCKYEKCFRHPEANCTATRCGECMASFSILQNFTDADNVTRLVGVDVTGICHIPIPVSRERPTLSGCPDEEMEPDEPDASPNATSTVSGSISPTPSVTVA